MTIRWSKRQDNLRRFLYQGLCAVQGTVRESALIWQTYLFGIFY